MRRLSISALLLIFCVSLSYAQVAYYCDFEDATEVAQWHLNHDINTPAANLSNIWRVGAAGNFAGTGKGLYISPRVPQNPADTLEAKYERTSVLVLSYRDLTLSPGTYTIVYDRRCGGAADAYAMVHWVSQSVTRFSSMGSFTAVPNWANPASTPATRDLGQFQGDAIWMSESHTFTVTAANSQGRLVVTWVNGSGTAMPPSACIDNICIYEGTPCENAPGNLSYSENTGRVTWTRPAGANNVSYEVCTYNTHDGTVSPIASATTTTWTPTLVGSGYFYFYVRTLCADSIHSGWARTGTFAYDKTDMCIDYLDLSSSSCKCYVGPFDDVTGSGGSTSVGKRDYGYASIESLHTIHYINDKDPNTNFGLSMIPPGEIASVRLGNWRDDNSIAGQGQGEAIEYTYQVQSGMSDILNINYAVVMEKPGHNDGTDPHFTLEILDSSNRQIGGTKAVCYQADFAAASDRPQDLIGWNEWTPPGAWAPVIWKPWTTISVSLRDYVGQQLKIRFTTKDCRQAAHWAYAYFTLSCSSGSLEGVSCGDFSTDHFTAPDGFTYRWYVQDDPRQRTVSTAQTLNISPTSDTIYCVELSQTFGNNCGYTLVANPNPLFPRVVVDVEQQLSQNCDNSAVFANNSKVYCINRQTRDTMPTQGAEVVDEVIWDWGDGSPAESIMDEKVTHVFPDKGGTYHVTVTASMNGGVCVDTRVVDVTFPNLEDAGKQDTTTYHRVGTSTKGIFTGKNYTSDRETTLYDTKTIKNQYGCDVECTHKMVFRNDVIWPLKEKVCQGGRVTFSELYGYNVHNDTVLTTAGQYERRHQHGDVMIVDTTFVLTLEVQDTVRVQVPDTIRICGHDEAAFFAVTPEQGNYIGVNVVVGEKGQNAGLNASYLIEDRHATYDEEKTLRFDMPAGVSIRPDYYPIELEFPVEDGCTVHSKPAILEVRYGASEFLDQKFGFVFLLNADHNYGQFEYATYEWYRDSVLMPDEHDSYINVTNADLGHEFYVIVTRQGETTPVASCPIEYTSENPQSIGNALSNKTIRAIYDLLGRKQNKMNAHGVYVVIYDDGSNEKIVY